MNEYSRIQNTKDRAALLAQLVNADARAMQATAINGGLPFADAWHGFEESRYELWKLIGPAEEGEATA